MVASLVTSHAQYAAPPQGLPVRAAVFHDDLAGCTLFVAPSIIPNAGLGLFTTEAYVDEQKLHLLPADIAIPYGVPEDEDEEEEARAYRMGGLKRYDWRSGTADDAEHPYMPYYEGEDIFEIWSGFGAVCNSEHHYENVENGSGPNKENDEIPSVDQYERPHPGTDAYTPFHHRYAEATKDIAAGAELFNNYGDGFFLNKKDNPYDFVPLNDDYDNAKTLMTAFSKNNSISDTTAEQDAKLQESWNKVVESAQLRVQTALNKNVTRVLETRGEEFSLGENKRPVEWVRSEGICIDRVRIGASDILEAGRGVFAKYDIAASTVILPVPVVQVNRTMQQITHHGHEGNDNGNSTDASSGNSTNIPLERMMVNYCIGHEESTMLLCPYLSTVSLINHSSEPAQINAKLTLSSSKYVDQSIWQTSSHELLEDKRSERSLGIMFDIVATRDIARDEEIYINYGASWQQAWDEHMEAWKPFVSDLDQDSDALEPLVQTTDCTVDYSDDGEGDESDVPKCLEIKVLEILQQSPQERHTTTPPTGCYYFPDWDANSVLSHDDALEMQANEADSDVDSFQVHPWQYEVSGWEDVEAGVNVKSDDKDDVVTGTVGGLYPCHILASQAAGDDEDGPLYTVMVLLDHDIVTAEGMDYDENDADDLEDVTTQNQGPTTRRQAQLVKNVPLWALRSITQEWRNQHAVNHFDAHEEGYQMPVSGPRTPAPFRHYIGVEDHVFPDAWKDLR